MTEQKLSPAERRVWAQVPDGARASLERGLSPTDLQTMLLATTRVRAGRVAPSRLMNRWSEDRFVQPSRHDPRKITHIETCLWDLLPAAFQGIELSPLAPLGTCSSLASVSQNRIVSTVRGTEVLSDPTNALAVEAATRRRGSGATQVNLAASHRVVRAQALTEAGLSAHFRLFALVSSGRDVGGGRTEAQMLINHLQYWAQVLNALLPRHATQLTTTVFDSPVLAERLNDTVMPALTSLSGEVEFRVDPTRTHGLGYYTGAALGIYAWDQMDRINIGDGGFTTWTRDLLSDAKERCLISCIATERVSVIQSAQANRT